MLDWGVCLPQVDVHSAIYETYFVQRFSRDQWSIGGGSPLYICILLYLKLIQCSGITQIYGQLEEGALVYMHSSICDTYAVQWYCIDLWSIGGGGLGICAFAICGTYMVQWYSIDLWSIGWGCMSALGICANILGVVVFQTSMLNWRRGWSPVCHGYMCILLYVKLIWCSGVAQIYCQVEEGMGSFCHGYMCVVHSAIYETYMVQWCCIDLCSIEGGSICHGYMYILLYVKVIVCSGVAEICYQLGGISAMGIYAFFYM